MKIMKPKEKEKIVCFCPYCKAFSPYPSKFKPNEKKRGYPFQCYTCKKYFNNETYIEQKHNKKRYHINGESKNTMLGITKFVINLYKIGLSQRNIQEITHLPRTLIQKTTSKKKEKKEISIEEFFKNNLKIDEDISRNSSDKIGRKSGQLWDKSIDLRLGNYRNKYSNRFR